MRSTLLSLPVWSWIAAGRAIARPRARPLTVPERSAMSPWFAPELLDTVRLAENARILPAPRSLRGCIARRGLLHADLIAGITYGDTILLAGSLTASPRDRELLFHELVHVAQYRRLGLCRFARHYVRGWLAAGRCYRDIPLEQQAYDLTARFARAEPFSVADEIECAASPWAASS